MKTLPSGNFAGVRKLSYELQTVSVCSFTKVCKKFLNFIFTILSKTEINFPSKLDFM